MRQSRTTCPGSARCRPGFTILELLVALTLSSVVLVGVLGVVSAETRRLSLEREISDTWYTLRSAAALMAWDIRQAAAGDAALAAITPTSFIIRSPTAAGVVCGKIASENPQYTIRDATGLFIANDSMQLLLAAETPSWEYALLQAVGTPGFIGPATCATPGTAPSQGIRLVVPQKIFDVLPPPPQSSTCTPVDTRYLCAVFDTADVKIGVPFMAYRRTLYGITTHEGRQWLGRQVGAAIGSADPSSWELLTGPLRADGLQFSYFTAGGAPTADPLAVTAVRITLRAESYGRTFNRERMQDTVSLRVGLRNCDPTVC